MANLRPTAMSMTRWDGSSVSIFIYVSRGHGPDYTQRNGSLFRIITDHLGRLRLVFDLVTGLPVQQLAYDEFGNVLANTNPGFQPFGFAGGLYDRDMKLTRFGARDYDEETGRWTSKDPILFAGGDTNLDGYALQDPVNLIDPNGNSPIFIPVATGLVGGIVGAIGGGINSNACSTWGKIGDAVAGGLVGFAGGFVAGLDGLANTVTGGVIGVIGGVAIDVGIQALNLSFSGSDLGFGSGCPAPSPPPTCD